MLSSVDVLSDRLRVKQPRHFVHDSLDPLIACQFRILFKYLIDEVVKSCLVHVLAFFDDILANNWVVRLICFDIDDCLNRHFEESKENTFHIFVSERNVLHASFLEQVKDLLSLFGSSSVAPEHTHDFQFLLI